MALIERSADTMTSIVGTEVTFSWPPVAVIGGRTYVLIVDVSNMASGDTIEIRCKVQVNSTSSQRIWSLTTLTNAQMPQIWTSDPIPDAHQFVATLKQTAGTARLYPWSIVSLD